MLLGKGYTTQNLGKYHLHGHNHKSRIIGYISTVMNHLAIGLESLNAVMSSPHLFWYIPSFLYFFFMCFLYGFCIIISMAYHGLQK